MKKQILAILSALFVVASFQMALALSNAHWVTGPSATKTSDNDLTVTGKAAGLGGVPDIFVRIQVDAACLNNGNNFPSAANKQSIVDTPKFPVQNGKADVSETVVATMSPKCTPPMTVVFGPVNVTVYGSNPNGTINLNQVLIPTETLFGPGPSGTYVNIGDTTKSVSP